MNAYAIQAELAELGVTITDLGCVMLQVEPLPVAELVPADWAYVARNPARHWIKGMQAGDHVTLLYGLLRNANTIRPLVDRVLEGWQLPQTWVQSVGAFPSTFNDEPYSCIVGHIEVSPELIDAHARLSLLPHIDTHPTYRPHLTLGYVHRDREAEAIERLGVVTGELLEPVGLDYGRRP